MQVPGWPGGEGFTPARRRARHRGGGSTPQFVIGSLIRVGDTGQTISHLGAQDVNRGLNGFATEGDGFAVPPINVGLWTGNGSTLLASVSVDDSRREPTQACRGRQGVY